MQRQPTHTDPTFSAPRYDDAAHFEGARAFGAYPSPFVTAPAAEAAPESASDALDDLDAAGAEVDAVEVKVAWGDSVLHVAHLSPPRAFYVGEPSNGPCDVVLPEEALGSARLPIVEMDGEAAYVVVPSGADTSIRAQGRSAQSVSDAIASGIAQPCPDRSDAVRVRLAEGANARVCVGPFVFDVRAVHAARNVVGHAPVDRRALGFQAVSLAAHAALLGATAIFMPSLAMAEDGGASAEQIYTLRQAIDAIAERERDSPQTQDANTNDDGARGGEGARSHGEEGKMGTPRSTAQNRKWGIAGRPDNTDVRVPARNGIEDASSFGMIAVLRGADMNAPTAPWGGEEALGRDPISAKGNLWGEDIGDAFGTGGLALTGIGEGGGGLGEGIGIGKLGIGHGGCLTLPCGTNDGFGRDHGRLTRGHKPEGAHMRQGGEVSMSGHIPAEVIQRIVRQNFGRFRLCYENGLRAQPSLQGRVAVRFVIGRDGSVSNASATGDLPDANVTSCVAQAFYGLSFPQPDAGIVTVTYPIVFSPGA